MDGVVGDIYKKLDSYISSVLSDSIFVEIGSDRWKGSTYELDRMAGRHSTRLVSVDILPDAKNRLEHRLSNTDFVIANGTVWAQEYRGPSISCLYLDNFDYIYDVNEINSSIEKQKSMYAEAGIVMNNQNCQVVHMSQMISLYPYLTENAVVMFDDTYRINDCWVGKCGAAVIFLLAQGWHIKEKTTDCGVVMVRG